MIGASTRFSHVLLQWSEDGELSEYVNAKVINSSASIRNLMLTNSPYLVSEAHFRYPRESSGYTTMAIGTNRSGANALFIRDVHCLASCSGAA